MTISDKIIKVRLDQIKPYKNNSKKHTKEQIESVKKSLGDNRYIQPIVIDGDYNIVIGHCRYDAMCDLYPGDAIVETISVDYLQEHEVNALRVYDNKINESEWDIEKLDDELLALSDILNKELFEMQTGFSLPEIQDELGTEFSLPDGDKSELTQIKFTLSNKQADYINKILFKHQYKRKKKNYQGNTNAFGNILYEVFKEWEKLKK